MLIVKSETGDHLSRNKPVTIAG